MLAMQIRAGKAKRETGRGWVRWCALIGCSIVVPVASTMRHFARRRFFAVDANRGGVPASRRHCSAELSPASVVFLGRLASPFVSAVVLYEVRVP